ncbi:MAG TPA: ATP phosphoribosyltransferase regulatory subunit, partial [Turneriella sp.]|nr:ATP phosphoribosyltransferase regulatory subunit [Turneriella sp.]
MSIEAAYRKVSSPYGFTMYDVEATQALEKASRAAQDLIRAHGFERIMPAMIDYPETFAEGAHRDIFSIKDNSGENLVLRNDITAQVVKGYVRQIERK